MTRPSNFQPAYGQLLNISQYLASTSIDQHLLDLISLRASQINGCAFCLTMHVRDLLGRGERQDRIAVLPAWRETTWFTDRERAALAWTETLTILGEHGVSDELFVTASEQFSERELADLTLAVILINGWNRLNIAFQNPPAPFTDDEIAIAATTVSV
ncbi:MAG TPA: carboxymuconolactone decarboxylase family protein [Thermomicrobiales bacterium]|nr:carboxymuconolactone decarboxylase family protein [Thermomicrobiales bacterium]